MPFAETWMDLEIVILSEVSQTEKDKYHMISLICGMVQMNLFAAQKWSHRREEQTCYQGRGRVGTDRLGDWD